MDKNKKVVSGTAFDSKLLKRILAYVTPYKKQLGFAIFTTIALACISPLRPWLVQYTIDHCVVQPDGKSLMFFSVIMVMLLMTETLLQFYDSFYSSWLGQTVVRDMRTEVFKKISELKLSYYDQNAVGTLVTRSVNDTETISDVFSQGFLVIIGDLLKLSVLIGVMFYTDWKLALISMSTIPVLIVATWIFKNAVKKAFQDVRTQVARLNAFAQEHITGMAIVQIFNKEKVESEKFSVINNEHSKANIRSVWHYSVFFPVVEILSSISLGLLVWWGSYGVLDGQVSLGNLTAFILYINMMFRPIRMLADRFNTLQMGMVSSERIFNVMDTKEKIENKGNYRPEVIKGEVEFKDVWFAYKDENWVLKGLSFKVEAGNSLALVGATGSGKSSIVSLINRFYEYQKGEILLDGINIREYDLKYLREKMAVVLQDVFLFSDSIINNIRLGDETISEETIIASGKQIGADVFIQRLPGAYHYNVMERGNTLSVGQRQLISFIRAYVHQPSILILDEATSSIDTESEVLIQKAVDIITQNRTSIIVAHRLSTIQKAHQILVMDGGKIMEQGNHESLLLKNGHYKKLYELQFLENA